MSSAPNPSPRPSQPASAQPQAEDSAHLAPQTSSPAETMTDQNSNSLLITPPTRMTSSDPAGAGQPTPETVTAAPPASTPVAPTPPAAAAQESATVADSALKPAAPRHQPIPPASEPMQYRAIGLVRGKYEPSEEQFTRGALMTEDGVTIDAVLLGRVMSLVKKHIDLSESHLWVVYPRTREKGLDLHMQIVGVWEPEKLNRTMQLDDAEALDGTEALDDTEALDNTEDADAEDDSETKASLEEAAEADAAPALQTLTLPSPDDLDDRYFSVRGEVVYQSEEEDRLLIKIRRAPKPGSTQAKAFKVALKGKLNGKGLGYFWDFQVQRESNDLVITEATQIGMVPPQKRGAGDSGPRRFGGGGRGGPRRPGGPGSGPPRKRWQDREGGQSSRPQRDRSERSERPQRPMSANPSQPRQPISKPVKRPKPEEG